MTNPSIASDLIERRDTLFDAIAHGDDDHRAWLKEAIDAHFAGQPVPECRGKGRKEAALSQLTREVDELREALEECRLIVANLPHGEELLLRKIDKALSRSSGGMSDAQ